VENQGRRSVRQGEIGVGEYPRVNAPSDVSRRGAPLYKYAQLFFGFDLDVTPLVMRRAGRGTTVC
jgi:hypothetical protein